MASRQIFSDIEEALAREIRKITYHDERIVDKVVLRETYDPFSGEVVQVPIEPEFYDSSADAGTVQYPHIFIRLLKTKEDRTTGRVVPQYGQWIRSNVVTSPKAFEIVIGGSSGLIPVVGNDVTVTAFQIRKVQVGHLLRLLNGNNKGTYTISNIIINNNGNHTITVSSTLLTNLPSITFNSTTRVIQFGTIDLSAVKIGDSFIDSGSNSFTITAVDIANGRITIGGTTAPLSSQGGQITRSGNVFTSTDLSLVRFLVLDPTKPVEVATICGTEQGASETVGVSPPIPIDAFYMVRIDSKTRENHRDILNRVWEEFNPPRTALPVIIRSALSADQLLTVDIPTGGSSTISVQDNSKYNVGQTLFIFDELHPVIAKDGQSIERPFEAKVIDVLSNNQILLDKIVPDTYTTDNVTRVVSNADFGLYMFHLEDHVTKDVEGSQYWVHEFTFWVQLFVDRYESTDGSVRGSITDIQTDIEDFDGNIYIDDN